MWKKIKADNLYYQEMKIPMGSLNIFLTASSKEWHIETGSGESLAKGLSKNLAESQEMAIREFKEILNRTILLLK